VGLGKEWDGLAVQAGGVESEAIFYYYHFKLIAITACNAIVSFSRKGWLFVKINCDDYTYLLFTFNPPFQIDIPVEYFRSKVEEILLKSPSRQTTIQNPIKNRGFQSKIPIFDLESPARKILLSDRMFQIRIGIP